MTSRHETARTDPLPRTRGATGEVSDWWTESLRDGLTYRLPADPAGFRAGFTGSA